MKTKNPPITVKKVFENHFEEYKKSHKIRDIEQQEVKKMLNCKDQKRGYFLYQCKSCGTQYKLALGCNSRLCTSCSKRYVDKWADQLTKKLLKGIEHRHITLSLPSDIWPHIKENRDLQKTILDTASQTISEFFLPTSKAKT